MVDGEQVQEAVDALAAALGLPVLVEDRRFRPLWWSAQGAVDGTRMRTILQRAVDPAAASLVTRWGLPDADGPIRTPAAPEVDMLARWCVPMREHGTLLGYLWVVDGEDRVTDDQLPLLVECAQQASDHLGRTREDQRFRQDSRAVLLARLLAGPDDDAARELLSSEGLPPDTAVTVEAPGRAGGWSLPMGMSAHTSQPAGHVATGGPPVAVLLLATAVARARAVRRVIAAGAELPSPTWGALRSWRLIVETPEEVTVSDVHPGAEVLLALPRTELATTARVLLERDGDVMSAAQRLHVHRTTLYYRLERIEALTGVNLRSGVARNDLRMALRLAAYRQAAELDPPD